MKALISLSLCCFVLTITACQRGGEQAELTTHNDSSSPTELTRHAATPGKPSAPINVTYQLLDHPSVSAPLHIEISIQPRVAASAVKLEYTVQGNMNSIDPSMQASFMATAAEQVIKHTIQVAPQGEGQHRVNVFVTLITQDGQAQTEVLVIPVVVGTLAGVKKIEHPNKAAMQTDAHGQPIIVLPAEETHK
jgi:hypothetical protein